MSYAALLRPNDLTALSFNEGVIEMNNFNPHRAGLRWSEVEVVRLAHMVYSGYSMRQMMLSLQRPYDDILAKLSQYGLGALFARSNDYRTVYYTERGKRLNNWNMNGYSFLTFDYPTWNTNLAKLMDEQHLFRHELRTEQIESLLATIQHEIPTPTPEKENAMSQENANTVTAVVFDPKGSVLQNITLIAGKDASQLTDDYIFELIRKAEAEVTSLQSIKNKPKKLEAKIESIKADIAALVKFVDERE